MNVERRWFQWALASVLGALLATSIDRTDAVRAEGPPSVCADDPFCMGTGEPPLASIVPSPSSAPIQDPPTPVVAIRVRVPAYSGPAEELEYRICVENPSVAPAHNVIVRNPLPAHAKFLRARPAPSAKEPDLVWELGTLEACTKREIVLVLLPTGTGDVKSCARVQFEHGQCVCTKIPKAALQLRKEGPSQAVLGETLTYKLTVTNTGEVEAQEVKLTDGLPVGLEHADGRKRLFWNLGTLPPGRSRTVEYQVVAKVLGKHCNQAVASAANGLHEEVESCVTIGEAKLAITKAGPSRRYINLPATYDFTVTNEGTATLTNVAITDPVPEGTTFVQASDDGQVSEGQVRWIIGTLEPGASHTVHVVFRATGAARVCNRATATADRGLNAQAEICTEFVGISALLLEVVDTEDPVELGGETSYLIIVRNQGSLPATRVSVTALVPEQEQSTTITGPAAHKQEGRTITFNPFTLPARGEARFTVSVRALRAADVRFKVLLAADQLTAGPVEEQESTTLYEDLEENEKR